MTDDEIQDAWAEIVNRSKIMIRSRGARIRIMGICWGVTGVLMLAVLLWSLLVHHVLPWILLTGLIPLAYGVYLLWLPPAREPEIEPPRLFGRGL